MAGTVHTKNKNKVTKFVVKSINLHIVDTSQINKAHELSAMFKILFSNYCKG